MKDNHPNRLWNAAEETLTTAERLVGERHFQLIREEVGEVISVGRGVAEVAGLPDVQAEELVDVAGVLGLAFDLRADRLGVVLLGSDERLRAGAPVRRTGRILDVPVGEVLLGRVINPLGEPLDDRGPFTHAERLPVERPSPPISRRAPVSRPLQTGIKIIDALIPIGRGQRELILGDRQTGKTAIALDTILNQRGQDVHCIYCAVGQRASGVAKFISELRASHALEYCTLVVAVGNAPPGLQFVAPYAATSIAEYFVEQGRDVLIVYDDLTCHARAYRELSLLMRRPPGREAFPGDIFYLHARLLERSAQLAEAYGGGSLTALPILETQAQDLSAYIPTNLISITDGQIYLSPELFSKAVFPAVDVGKSVSRVGGKAQLPCFRTVTGDLRLTYAQFGELESFARFGTRLDEQTLQTLERGRRIRETLKQPRFTPLSVPEQIASLHAVSSGLLDSTPIEEIPQATQIINSAVVTELADLATRMTSGERLTSEDLEAMTEVSQRALARREGGT